MNIYKYQIIKYLLTQNKDAKQLKKMTKDELIKEFPQIKCTYLQNHKRFNF